jgi:hypothetical protein
MYQWMVILSFVYNNIYDFHNIEDFIAGNLKNILAFLWKVLYYRVVIQNIMWNIIIIVTKTMR